MIKAYCSFSRSTPVLQYVYNETSQKRSNGSFTLGLHVMTKGKLVLYKTVSFIYE